MPTIHLFTFITAAIGTVINGVLIFLVLRKSPKGKGSWFLAGWFAFLNFLIQIVGSLIIATSNPSLALRLYRLASVFTGMFAFFFFFVKEYLELKIKSWVAWVVGGYVLATAVTALIVPHLFIKSVSWDPHVQFYLANFEFRTFFLAAYTGMFLWFYGTLKLLQTYRKSRSAIERNRLKYLILGGLLPVLGMILITIPILTIRRYPLDMWGVTFGAICLAYGVLRYQLLDITVIIRKGLLYSILTMAVTGIYLLFSLALQLLIGRPEAPISMPAVVSTAVVVALVFQPLQNTTQKFIDRVFFRRKYNPQYFVSHLSEICASTLDLQMLSESLTNSVTEILQVGKAGLFLVKRGTNRLHLAFQKGLKKEAGQLIFTTDRPLAQFLNQSDEVKLVYDLKDKRIPLEDLDKQGLELFVPLRSREKLRGVLALGPKLSGELYSLEELNILQTVADPTALALENAQLFTQIKEEKERVEKLLANRK